MEIYLYVLVIFFVILLFRTKNKERFESINNLDMDNNKVTNFDFPEMPELIELEQLSVCSQPVDTYLGFNQNYIVNNGEFVSIDMLRQISRNYVIFNKKDRFQVRSMRIGKSNILDNGKSYLLQVTFVTSGATGLCDFNIVVPLEFSKEPELKLLNKNDVPQYKCCSNKYGPVIKHDLKEVSKFLGKTTYRRFNLNSKQHLLVSLPAKISVDLGLDILEKLKSKGEDEISQKESWLEQDFLEM